MLYNDSFMNNATNILDLMTGIGSQLENQYLMGYMILLAFAVIFLIMAFKNNFVEVVVIDSFLSTIIAILLYITGMLPISIIVYPIIILVLALVIYLFF